MQSEYKYEVMILRNKVELLEKRERELEDSLDHRDDRIRETEREGSGVMKRSQEDLLEKLNSYELEVRKNAR